MSPPPPVVESLRELLGAAAITTDADRMATFETDWTRRFTGRALAVVLPRDASEVGRALAVCERFGVSVVPQGGNTGLVGGGVPRGGEVVLSTRRLDRIEVVDGEGAEATVGAGTTLQALQESARAAGYDTGVDLAARGSATIGGMVATNAGGNRVLRYGDMRSQVLGLELALAGGSLVDRLHGPAKDNTGYALPALVAGSEGTLAVITRVRMRLVPVPRHRVAALLAFESLAAGFAAVQVLRRTLGSLESAEVFFRDGLDLVCAHGGLQPPFATAYDTYVLVECAATGDPLPALADTLATVDGMLDSAVASDRPGRDALWAYRERHTESVNAAGVPQKLDVAVPADAVVPFVAQLRVRVAQEPAARLFLWGHLAEGNFHVNLVGPAPDDERLADAVLQLVLTHHGSISSEHGIGVAKARWLEHARSAADITLMQRIKLAFDPAGILNPGVLFPRGRA